MAIDLKYGQVTVERPGDMGDDEPVIVFRSKDRLLPMVLGYYSALCEAEGSPEGHLNRLDETMDRVKEWQRTHFTQTPGIISAE